MAKGFVYDCHAAKTVFASAPGLHWKGCREAPTLISRFPKNWSNALRNVFPMMNQSSSNHEGVEQPIRNRPIWRCCVRRDVLYGQICLRYAGTAVGQAAEEAFWEGCLSRLEDSRPPTKCNFPTSVKSSWNISSSLSSGAGADEVHRCGGEAKGSTRGTSGRVLARRAVVLRLCGLR